MYENIKEQLNADLNGFGAAPWIGKDEIGPGDKRKASITAIDRTSKGGFRATVNLDGFGERCLDLSARNQQKIKDLFGGPIPSIGRSVWISGRASKDRTGRDIVSRDIEGVA